MLCPPEAPGRCRCGVSVRYRNLSQSGLRPGSRGDRPRRAQRPSGCTGL